MGISYIKTDYKGQHIVPQQAAKKNGPLALACHFHIWRPTKKQKLAGGQGYFQSNMSSFLEGMEQNNI